MNNASEMFVEGKSDVHGICPSDEELCRFVERRLSDEQMVTVAEHIASCANCRDVVKDIAEWVAAGMELESNTATSKGRIEGGIDAALIQRAQVLWQKVFDAVGNAHEYLAAADGQTANQIQQRNANTGSLTFVSNPPPPHMNSWRAEMILPSDMGADDMGIRFQVFDAEESTIQSGVLRFCGVDLEVEDGYAFMKMGDFRRNMRVAQISLTQGDGVTVPGVLTFAYGF